jgi:hypothetical protein
MKAMARTTAPTLSRRSPAAARGEVTGPMLVLETDVPGSVSSAASPAALRLTSVLVYALISEQIGRVIEFYATREEAEAELGDALSDEPDWESVLYVVPVELDSASQRSSRLNR